MKITIIKDDGTKIVIQGITAAVEAIKVLTEDPLIPGQIMPFNPFNEPTATDRIFDPNEMFIRMTDDS